MATLQQQVQQHMDSVGIKRREFARRSGVSHTTINKLLNGEPPKKAGTKQKLIDAMQPKTLQDKVEQLAADRLDCDVMTRDDALECSKQRRIEALEAEVQVWRKKERQACEQAREMAHNLQDVLEKREQHLKSCENALIEAHTERDNLRNELADTQDKLEYMKRLASEDGQKIRERDSTILDLDARMDAAKAEIKRLTALSETHSQSWKAACVQVEQLQKQLDHANSEIVRMDNQLDQALEASQKSAAFAFEIALNRDALQSRFDILQSAYDQQVDDEREMLAQIDTLFAERDNTATKHDQQVMRLRGYVWILIAALVFILASGFMVLRGAV